MSDAIEFFIVVPKVEHAIPRAAPGRASVALQESGWDDYGYLTTFDVFLSAGGRSYERIGTWKILDVDAPRPGGRRPRTKTALPERFQELPANFVSLAQDTASYIELGRFGVQRARALLQGLRDVAVVAPPRSLRLVHGFETSLVRFPRAREAYERGPSALAKLGILRTAPTPPPEAPLAFDFRCRLPGTTGDWTHRVDLALSRGQLGLHRMWALVGDNGAGKTLLLAALARKLSGLEDRDATVTPEPTFRKIIAVSYSPWDTFVRPSGEGDRISYVYCGLRARGDSSPDAPLKVDSARRTAADDLELILSDATMRKRWRAAMRDCDLGRPGSPLATAMRGGDFVTALHRSSAGEQLAAIVITRLVRHVEPGALVLFDEPELHMHPNLLSALLRTLNDLLNERDAFAIVGTHSPIPLQEIPARCVRVLDVIDGVVYTRRLDEQCFGASLGDIVASAFRTRQDQRNWVRFIQEHGAKPKMRDRIVTALDGNPGLGVRMLLAALSPEEVSET